MIADTRSAQSVRIEASRAAGPSWRYVVPFATLMVLLGGLGYLPLRQPVAYAIRTAVVAAVFLIFSRRLVSLRASRPFTSVWVGVAVFAVWVGPDLLWPGYHDSWLFRNALTGGVPGSAAPDLLKSPWLLWFRVGGSVLVVPIVEELFWRAWLMRRLISSEIAKVPLGAYAPVSFWLTALLFASEHGPYWDVGLLAGVLYNGWMVRTRNLADCIVAHAVTNGCLAAYVLLGGAWQYWL